MPSVTTGFAASLPYTFAASLAAALAAPSAAASGAARRALCEAPPAVDLRVVHDHIAVSTPRGPLLGCPVPVMILLARVRLAYIRFGGPTFCSGCDYCRLVHRGRPSRRGRRRDLGQRRSRGFRGCLRRRAPRAYAFRRLSRNRGAFCPG
jgi:hypothetical protein